MSNTPTQPAFAAPAGSAIWKPWDGGDCPHCGSGLEIQTDAPEDGFGYDGDPLRCQDCGCPGQLVVCDEDDACESMHDDPDCRCEWCLTHPEIGCACGHCTPNSVMSDGGTSR